jgi:chorismate-pyruvate lyase
MEAVVSEAQVQARRAGLYVCGRLPKDAAAEVLAALGLIPAPSLAQTWRDSLGRATEPAGQRARRDNGRYRKGGKP